MAFAPILRGAVRNTAFLRDGVMLFVPDSQTRLHRLAKRLQDASAPDARLFSDVIANASERTLLLVEARRAGQLKRLIEAGAWTDAALALVELELPQWKLRRLACDDGQWHCRLSAQPGLPDGFDDIAEATHEVIALAILGALVEARSQLVTGASADDAPAPRSDVARPVRDGSLRVCCDNFS
jgi:hypothetical protein